MFKNNTIYVSPNYTKNDYWGLDLSEDRVSCVSEDFQTAVEIFKDRIRGYYLNQINALIKSDSLAEDQCGSLAGNNCFAIMALECLLVETLAQFAKGLLNTNCVSRDTYAKFLKNDLKCCRNITHANLFYHCIRCGILHQAQAKENAGLDGKKTDHQYPVYHDHGFLIVSVPSFAEKIENFFNDYCQDLLKHENGELRKKFITKMNFVCDNQG